MLHELPIHHIRLTPCSVGPEQLTPSAQGHYCRSCDREVVDFTAGTTADVLRAQAAAPDGRLCGRFYRSQLAPESRPPALRTRLRQFLLVAVLVLVQSLTAREAWAQVQPRSGSPAPWYAPAAPAPAASLAQPQELMVFGAVAEKMPQPPGGIEGLMKFLGNIMQYPATTAEGKVFVAFIVQPDGRLTGFEVVKGVDPLLDAEALRVLRLMPAWTPGEQNGHPVAVRYTLPITFTLASEAPKQRRR